jgi:hypothetical protein
MSKFRAKLFHVEQFDCLLGKFPWFPSASVSSRIAYILFSFSSLHQ